MSFLGDFFGNIGSDVSNLFSSGGGASDTQSQPQTPAPTTQDYTQLSPDQQVQQDVSQTPSSGYGATDVAPSLFQDQSAAGGGASGGGFFNSIGNYLSQPQNLAKIGLAGAGLGLGLYQTNQAQKQGAAAQQQIAQIPQNVVQLSQASQQQLNQIGQQYQAMVNNAAAAIQGMAQPIMQQFTQLTNLTNEGKLTPANQQVLDAAKARLAQDAANRGGVGAEQSQTQIDRLYQGLLDSQMQQALQMYQTASPGVVSGIETGLSGTQAANQYQVQGLQTALDAAQLEDQYAAQAIQTGLQNDTQARSSMGNFYTALANVLAGSK
jgi:hypothetical protein